MSRFLQAVKCWKQLPHSCWVLAERAVPIFFKQGIASIKVAIDLIYPHSWAALRYRTYLLGRKCVGLADSASKKKCFIHILQNQINSKITFLFSFSKKYRATSCSVNQKAVPTQAPFSASRKGLVFTSTHNFSLSLYFGNLGKWSMFKFIITTGRSCLIP